VIEIEDGRAESSLFADSGVLVCLGRRECSKFAFRGRGLILGVRAIQAIPHHLGNRYAIWSGFTFNSIRTARNHVEVSTPSAPT